MVEIVIWLAIGLAAGAAAGWFGYRYKESRKPPPPVPPTVTEVEEARRLAAELEVSLKAATEEAADLRMKSGIARPGEEDLPLIEGSLTWRNRRLEARVRFLEARLTDLEAANETQRDARAHADEATRLGWRNTYLQGRVRYLEEEMTRVGLLPRAAPSDQADAARTKMVEGEAPDLFGSARGKADDLKQIAGIGPKLEQKLNSLGIWHHDQIAGWTQANVDWVNSAISFRGRIERERWVSQAKDLLRKAAAPAAERIPEELDS
jgi:predicted flap endonuclease-1-like 5' DNA nuclease